MVELLQKLINLLGPSGNEQAVRNLISHEIKKFVDEVRVDKFGNLIAHKKGKGPKIMLAAHMDEVGLMVHEIRENGQLKFTRIGGIEPITLVGQRVCLMAKDHESLCNGVITFHELHEDLEQTKIPDITELYVDTGLTKSELKKKGVAIGTYIVPQNTFAFLGSKDIISGKALDDRLGCYILIRLAQKLKSAPGDIYFAFTVQEEVGLYGAQTSVYEIDPDYGIAVDTTNAEDSTIEPNISIGKGPSITVMDSEMIANKCLNDWLVKVAEKSRIPYQLKVEESGTTDATRIMLSKGGVPSTVITIPIRNIHSTVGVANLNDVENAIKLLYHVLKQPPKVCLV